MGVRVEREMAGGGQRQALHPVNTPLLWGGVSLHWASFPLSLPDGGGGLCDLWGGLLRDPCCIDCGVEKYCAFPNADRVFGVNRVYGKKLMDIGRVY